MDVQMNEEIKSINDVIAGPIAVGSVSAFLHPLVIMNISEHWTRLRAQEGSPQLVFGALIGRQKGRNIEIMNSFELNYTVENDNIQINRVFYLQKEEQFKQVFPDLDFLGWYTTGESGNSGDKPNAKDIYVHKQICNINESPVFLKLNPFVSFIFLKILN
jgi:COP9 signalosome complex subunit 6